MGEVLWYTPMSLDGFIAEQNDDRTWGVRAGRKETPPRESRAPPHRGTCSGFARQAKRRPQAEAAVCRRPSTTAPRRKREWMPRETSPASVRGVQFSRELRDGVLAGEITLSVRLWKRPQVKEGGRYRVGPGLIEIDAIELVPFAAITEEDVRRAGEPDRETLRDRAAHAGPIDDHTLVYRIELRAVSPED